MKYQIPDSATEVFDTAFICSFWIGAIREDAKCDAALTIADDRRASKSGLTYGLRAHAISHKVLVVELPPEACRSIEMSDVIARHLIYRFRREVSVATEIAILKKHLKECEKIRHA